MRSGENIIHGDLRSPLLNRLSKAINNSITYTFPDTKAPLVTHPLIVAPDVPSRYFKKYPTTLLLTDDMEGKETQNYYDLGAETINHWLLIKACDLVLSNLPPGISHGLKGLSIMYHLDLNPGFKELEEMGKKLDPKNLKSTINSSLFLHDHKELTTYWNGYKEKKSNSPENMQTDDFVLDIGRLACPISPKIKTKGDLLAKIQSKIEGIQFPHWIGGLEAVAKDPGNMLKPEWLHFLTLAELVGSTVALALYSQPLLATIMLGSSINNVGMSVLDEIYKNICTRAVSDTHFGIREIEWNKEVK